MSSNLPLWGKGAENGVEALRPEESSREAKAEGKRTARPRSKSQARTQQAINDATQGLHSLLNPQTDDTHPHIISPSGATRNQTRGRVAGPTADRTLGPARTPGSPLHLLQDGPDSSSSSLSVVPPRPGSATQPVPQTRLGAGVALATGQLQVARERANLLISPVDTPGGLSADIAALHSSRRAASQWVTRYATHLVILLVVCALVAVGGLKTFTAQGAYSHALQAANALTGTDYEDGKPDPDSQDYALALPRTELGGVDAAANSLVPQAARPSQGAGTQASAPVAGLVVQYKVAQGDTIESIAAKFNVMPETVMGSNGIYDSEEELASGRVLNIPPIDGMYYVAAQGDTVESIANRFQVEPDDLLSYKGNNISNWAVKPGQAILVPGGMIPPREATINYTVRPGDTLKGIAARYAVDVPTMINSNSIPDPDNLKIGSQLRILPVPGIEYKVKKGDNIESIADRFSVTPQMILDYTPNHLNVNSTLHIDQVVMVPGGSPQDEPVSVAAARIEPSAGGSSRPPERQPAPPEPPKSDNSGNSDNSDNSDNNPPAKPAPKPNPVPKPQPKQDNSGDNSPKVGTGRLIWPVNGTITQYFSSHHNGLDLAISAGTPIHAADSGRVVWAGWRTDGLGYCVIIDHLDGLTTVYGHQIRQPLVHVGQYVSRGQTIGWVGSTGHSTGPHVHFMIKAGSASSHAYRNPLAYLGR